MFPLPGSRPWRATGWMVVIYSSCSLLVMLDMSAVSKDPVALKNEPQIS